MIWSLLFWRQWRMLVLRTKLFQQHFCECTSMIASFEYCYNKLLSSWHCFFFCFLFSPCHLYSSIIHLNESFSLSILLKGCDASVLLNSKGNNKAEKDGPPNISLHAYYVIDNAKKALEAKCPGVVSCADILALAARDAVYLVIKQSHEPMFSSLRFHYVLIFRIWEILFVCLNWSYICYILQSGGPKWDVPKGRKDGRTSKASETRQLPAPTFNISQLQKSFSQRALSAEDLVALSGKLFLKL